jgi:hypothetical protein
MNATRHTNNWNDIIRTELDLLKYVSSWELCPVRFTESVHGRPARSLGQNLAEYMRARWCRQQFRLRGSKKHAFVSLKNELETEANDANS